MNSSLCRCPDCAGLLGEDHTVVCRERVWAIQTCKDCGADFMSWFSVDGCTRDKCHEGGQ